LPWRLSHMFTQWKCTLIISIWILFAGHCIHFVSNPAWPLTSWPLSQVSLGESLLEAETVENLDTAVNCFRKLFGTNSASLYSFMWESCTCSSSDFHLVQCVTFCRWSWIIQRCVFLSVCCINTCTKQQSFTYATPRGSRQRTDRCRVKAWFVFLQLCSFGGEFCL